MKGRKYKRQSFVNIFFLYLWNLLPDVFLFPLFLWEKGKEKDIASGRFSVDITAEGVQQRTGSSTGKDIFSLVLSCGNQTRFARYAEGVLGTRRAIRQAIARRLGTTQSTKDTAMSEASEEKGKENTSLSDDARFSWLFFSPMVAVNVHTDVSNHGLG